MVACRQDFDGRPQSGVVNGWMMALEIVGAGFGRTGTLSLKLALEALGVGPCHHMKEVVGNRAQIRLWTEAASGKANFDRIFEGFTSAVDWPVAAFWQEVVVAYPQAKVILSSRSSESWYSSFSQTILKTILSRDKRPESARAWFEMLENVVINRSLRGRTDRDGIIAAFEANEAAAKSIIPADRLLVFQAQDGWEPLCAFLGKAVPSTPFPKTNPKEDFLKAVEKIVQS